jgi:uncharacterized protein with HEPN domain
MLDHAKEAVSMARAKTRADLDKERLLNLALVRLLEIIGEAASRVPKNDRDLYLEIPWSEIVGLRNRLIHGYDEVDFDILWQIVRTDLPPLIDKLDKILTKQNPS